MSVRSVDQKTLHAWVDGLIKSYTVIGVQARDDHFEFAPLKKGEHLRLDYDVTILPPKHVFLPPQENLLEFDDASTFKSVIRKEPFVLLGVHPYDLVAINQMDQIFSMDNDDVHYRTNRENAVIVASDVQSASANVFAGCMGSATVKSGFDILLTRIGDKYVVESATQKGKELGLSLPNAPEATPVDLGRREQVWEDNSKFLRKHELEVELVDLPSLLERSYDHPVWEEKAVRCFSCGSCNMVCPTCYCFNVLDEVDWSLKSGRRYRTWDSCMLKEFAMVAGGHNFRKGKEERYRHRYFRKGKYIPDKIGQIACVGCGRCITACVPKIANPVEVYNRLLEDK